MKAAMSRSLALSSRAPLPWILANVGHARCARAPSAASIARAHCCGLPAGLRIVLTGSVTPKMSSSSAENAAAPRESPPRSAKPYRLGDVDVLRRRAWLRAPCRPSRPRSGRCAGPCSAMSSSFCLRSSSAYSCSSRSPYLRCRCGPHALVHARQQAVLVAERLHLDDEVTRDLERPEVLRRRRRCFSSERIRSLTLASSTSSPSRRSTTSMLGTTTASRYERAELP